MFGFLFALPSGERYFFNGERCNFLSFSLRKTVLLANLVERKKRKSMEEAIAQERARHTKELAGLRVAHRLSQPTADDLARRNAAEQAEWYKEATQQMDRAKEEHARQMDDLAKERAALDHQLQQINQGNISLLLRDTMAEVQRLKLNNTHLKQRLVDYESRIKHCVTQATDAVVQMYIPVVSALEKELQRTRAGLFECFLCPVAWNEDENGTPAALSMTQ